MHPIALQKIKQYIPENSPFFPLYTRNPTLDEVLNIPNLKNINVPSFSDALNVYLLSSGLSLKKVKKSVGFKKDSARLSHIKNRSGPFSKDAKNKEDYSRHPKLTGRHFLNIARCVDDNPISHARISIAFYDTKTGDLILRNRNKDIEGEVEGAINYLATSREMLIHGAKSWIPYLDGILTDRLKDLEKKNQINGEKNISRKKNHRYAIRTTSKNGVESRVTNSQLMIRKTEVKIGKMMNLVESALNLTPVYLINPLSLYSAKNGEERIKHHIEVMGDPSKNQVLRDYQKPAAKLTARTPSMIGIPGFVD